MGLQKSPNLGLYGKNNHLSKIIYQYDLSGEFIRQWNSISDVTRELKIFQSSIIACAKGKLKTSGGFFWSYIKLH